MFYKREEIKIEKTDYEWGRLRVITIGKSYSIVIHPEHWDKINKLRLREKCSFTDEQGHTYIVINEGGILRFKSRTATVLKIDKNKLV